MKNPPIERRTRPTRSNPSLLLRLVCSLLPGLGAGCDRINGESAALAEAPRPSPIAKVVVVAPEWATVRRIAEQPGQIEAAELTPIHAKLAGYVRAVFVDIGDRVKAGQVLAELQIPEIDAELRQKRAMIGQAEAERRQDAAAVEVAEAEVESAEAKVVEIRAGIRRAEAEIERWSAEFARVQQLAHERALVGSLVDETRSKLGAAQAAREEVNAQVRSGEAAVVRAKAMLDKARSDVQAADSHIEVARFDAEQAEAMASYTRIQAPFDGVVVRRKVDRGQLTTPGTSGEPLFLVARHDVATISVGVPETDAQFVNPGDQARIRLLAIGDRIFEGTVSRTAWALDSATRTLLVEIDLPNPDEVLRPGLYAYATIVADEHAGVLTLPATAVFKDGGKSFCVVVEEGRATRREIQVGLTEGKRIEVASGLGPDSQVVEANSASLTDGQAVETAKR